MIFHKNIPAVAVALLLATAAVLTACVGETQIKQKAHSNEGPVWPPEPFTPKIEYIGSLSKPEDLNIRKGIFGILKEVAMGEEDNKMILPMAIVKNVKNQLFVADPGKKAIHRFDKARGKYRLIKREGDRDFASPVGMAADSEGNVYIADSELAKVFMVGIDKDYAAKLPLDEDFIRPTGIAVDKKTGWIYVVDTGIHAIYVFNKQYSLVKKFSHRGTGDGELNFPTYIWQNKDGKLLVTDSLNFRIQIFDRYGGYLNKFGNAGNGTGDLARPKGVAEDSQGHVYVTDSLFHNVQVFSETGEFLINFGEQGNGKGQFWLPVGITITNDDTIYVADSYNKRVQVFRYIGSER